MIIVSQGIENLPYELQRNFTLMRELDQRTQDVLKEIDDMAENYTESVRNLPPMEKTEKLKKIEESFAKAKELSDDKVQLAMQTYEMVNKPWSYWSRVEWCHSMGICQP